MNYETELEFNKNRIKAYNKLLSDNKNIRLMAQAINNNKNHKLVFVDNKPTIKEIEFSDLINDKRIFKINKFAGTKKEAIEYIKSLIALEVNFLHVVNNNLIKIIKGDSNNEA